MRQHFKAIGVLLFIICFAHALIGQNLDKALILGRVSSSTGEPLVGVAMILKNPPIGTITGTEDDGVYIYRVNVENHAATKGAEVEANFVTGIYRLHN